MTFIATPETEKLHSWFSPSAAARLIRCPGSRKACEGLEDKGGPDADRGTKCHTFMELYYSGKDTVSALGSFEMPWQQDATNKAMEDCDALFTSLIEKHGQPELRLEEQVCLEQYPTVFGTVDMILYFPATRHLVILDHKFGNGIVPAKDNDQLLTYACGALVKWNGAQTIDLVINQPRQGGIDVWSITPNDVLLWQANVLYPAIEACRRDDAPLIPGDIQCKWCRRGKVGCSALMSKGLREAEAAKDSVGSMSATELALAANLLEFFKVVTTNIEAALFNRLSAGEAIPGWKLVQKGTKRTWLDVEKADTYLARKKLTQEQRYEKKLISPAAAERLLKLEGTREKNAFKELIYYPKGEPTFAPESDPRPAINPMQNLIDAALLADSEQSSAVDVLALAGAPAAAVDLSMLFGGPVENIGEAAPETPDLTSLF